MEDADLTKLLAEAGALCNDRPWVITEDGPVASMTVVQIIRKLVAAVKELMEEQDE